MKEPIVHIPKNLSFPKNIVKNLPIAIQKKLPREIAVIAVSKQESLKLNRKYRHKQKPANVLSFLYGPAYGEIIVCPQIVVKDAKVEGNTQVFQMTWYIVHGMLHLAGIHHEDSPVLAEKVAKIEQGVLSALGYKNKKIKVKNAK